MARVCAAVLPLTLAFVAQAHVAMAQTSSASADVLDANNKSIGKVVLTETPSGAVTVKLTASGLAPGEHAFHIHESGNCDASTKFESAGGHLAAGKSHGVMHADGPHPGDLPNIMVAADGKVTFEAFIAGAGQEWFRKIGLFDENGSAVVIHAGVDDYKSQPSGNAGGRVACGVLKK